MTRQVDLSSLSKTDVMQRVQTRVDGLGYLELSSLAHGRYDFTLLTSDGSYEFRGHTPKGFGRQVVNYGFKGGERAIDLTARKIKSCARASA